MREWLAGPILRRVEPSRVCVWITTSAPLQAEAEIFLIDQDPAAASGELEGHGLNRVGGGAAERVQLGERLFVHLIQARPDGDAFPTDVLLGYDVVLTSDTGDRRGLADLGLLPDLVYGGLPLPTFFVRGSTPTLHLLHGSCRLLHGRGRDALVAADQLLGQHARDVSQRPSALLLTGDQVYGDEVAGALIEPLRTLATLVCGEGDEHSVPQVPQLSTVPVDGRGKHAERARFTSSKADNHLLSFGEYAAMYLLAWDEGNWPDTLSPAAQALPDSTWRQRRRYSQHLEGLQEARRSIPAVRRALANCPMYTTFDDHDVTDDWNLTQGWRDRVHASPAGRRVVANALAAYWAFQGWGNQPDLYDRTFVDAVTGYLHGDGRPDAYERALWDFDRWSYAVPSDPPLIMLDTRTQRFFDSPEGAARLIGPAERARLIEISRGSGRRPDQPLLLVSAVPVYGLELQERRQKFLVGKLGPYEIDFEAWHSNLAGLIDFMRLLVDDLEAPTCVLLSGDIHYGMNVQARFVLDGKALPIAQLVSSSQKHSGVLSRLGLDAIGWLVNARHERLGWQCPPPVSGSTGLKAKTFTRAANTDEWDPDSPVFLSPRRARRLRVTQAPDYRESRRYVAPVERPRLVLVGANNIGLVSLRGNELVHRLFTSPNGVGEHYTVTLTLPASGEAAADGYARRSTRGEGE